MPLTHIEHPEDTILTGDLSVLDAFLSPEIIIQLKLMDHPQSFGELTQRMESSLSAPSPYLIRKHQR